MGNIGLSGDYDKDVDPDRYEHITSPRRVLQAEGIVGIIEQFCPAITPDGQAAEMLELAAGTGIITKVLKNRGYQVTALDYSGNMLDYLDQKSLGVLPVQADMNEVLPFKENAFHYATIVWANRFIDSKNLPSFLKEIRRVLRPDGIFVWPIFPIEGFLWRMKMIPNQLRPDLQKAGFRDIKTISAPFYVSGQPPLHSPGYLIAKK